MRTFPGIIIFRATLTGLALLFSINMQAADTTAMSKDLGWPQATRENHPWTRWWWLGSAVDETNLTRLLTMYHDAGIGGVEICPIYGAKGYEDHFIDFLSPKWMEMLAHTTKEAARLDLGVDMTTGTGWPFGGPRVTIEDASSKVTFKRYDLGAGEKLNASFPPGVLRCLMAISDNAAETNLITLVSNGHLDWTAPSGKWRLYAVIESGPVQQVKRAAPGGAGSVLDPYSVSAMDHYLADFDKAFANYKGTMPRSQFHDSFEYYSAQWTPEFFNEFSTRRGYDLRTQLPALFGEGSEEISARVQCDYRETISDLHLAYIQRWTAWAHGHGSLTRDQAHGAPANLLDVYAASDIPETEIFGGIGQLGVSLNKFSSSAAHVSGRKLASSESFTWLTEHFQANLSEVKQAVDYLFLSGVNHIFFHGIPYSPTNAPWPGFQFYAAVNFGPEGGLWHDLPQFNTYVTHCQSVLQSGTPIADVLLYFPVYDVWQTSGKQLIIPNPLGRSFTNAATHLFGRGYAEDHLSDRFLQTVKCVDGRLMLGGNSYRVVLVPQCSLMPETSLHNLIELARAGATILFRDKLPADVPGFANLEKRRAEFQNILKEVKLSVGAAPGVQRAAIGKGMIFVAADLDALLETAGVPREHGTDLGLRFVGRLSSEGRQYLVANRAKQAVDGWVTLGAHANSAEIMDPRLNDRVGMAAISQTQDGSTRVYLQLQPGESCILRTFTDKTVPGPAWHYTESTGAPVEIAGTWKVEFLEGGPQLPKNFETTKLGSWTGQDDEEAKRFEGTARYTIEFDRPAGDAADWMLDLGKVCESAKVKLNGQPVGAEWCAPFSTPLNGLLRPGKNTLEVEVTNLAANRVEDLDRRKVNWKYFYDANVAAKAGGPGRGIFDASRWSLFDSGLVGPVTLQPLKASTLAAKNRFD